MLPIARLRSTLGQRLQARMRRRWIPAAVAVAWLGALMLFVGLSRSSGAMAAVRKRVPPTFVVANQIFCVEAPPLDRCEPDDALARTAHMRISRRPCVWQPPICGNDRRRDDRPASACVQVPVLTRAAT